MNMHFPKNCRAAEWQHWKPQQIVANTCLVRDGEVLLMHKLRGFGEGKVVLPGGRRYPQEDLEACALREFEEEVGLKPIAPQLLGQCSYQFEDGLAFQIQVFKASSAIGTLQRSDEALPFWVPSSQIPYEQMWPDAVHWLPLILQDQPFKGRFLFKGSQMLDMKIRLKNNF
jgi:ADP-ribose pyrophosphatase YjhB (NUDIX family)